MQLSQIPLRMQLAWAANAGGSYIRTVPVPSQIGIQDGAASFNDGFPPDNFTSIAAGGVPPFGQDMNGVLKVITSWEQWLQAGGPIGYDATFSTAVGGYPAGAVLASNVTPGAQWYSLVDNNTTNPDDPLTSSGWVRVGLIPGTPVPLLTAAAQDGYLTANGLTVGSASSGAAAAAGKYLFVFKAIWDGFSNTQCPIFDSGGGVSTRGANAVADFQANKRLTTPNMKGLGVIGVDTMGGSGSTFLNGVPVTIGNATTPGSILGENLHTLSAGEAPTITSSNGSQSITVSLGGGLLMPAVTGGWTTVNTAGTGGFQAPQFNGLQSIQNVASISGANSISVTSNNTGGGAHNTVERNMAVFWGLKT